MMEHRESNLTHRQRSNEASLAWLLVCTVGAALFAVMIATQGALAHSLANHDPQATQGASAPAAAPRTRSQLEGSP